MEHNTMLALVYEKPGRANGSVRQIPIPVYGENQVLIKVMSCGVCKPAESSHDRNGSVLGKYPATPGHEFSGIVAGVGAKAVRFQLGERVTADNGVFCGQCHYCQAGEFAYCENFGSLGHNLQGGMAQYVALDQEAVYKLPDSVSFDAAALCELIGCCLHALERAGIRYGDHAAVFGCGSSGMILSQLLKHSSAGRVAALDDHANKLAAIAKKGVETQLIDRSDYGLHEAALRASFPRGLDIIFDTTGDAELINRSVALLKKGGRFVNYSFPTTSLRSLSIDMAAFIIRELSFIGTTFQHHSFERCIEALAQGVVDTECVITHKFPLSSYFEALDLNLHNSESVKVIIHPNN